MATEPDINVIEDAVTVYDNNPGQASTIAVIGAFDSTITALTNVTTARAAHAAFGTTGTAGTFKGTDVIDFLFIGASNLLIANITTWSEDSTPVASTTMTTEKLAAALNMLHNQQFDLLFIADELTDAQQTSVTTWLNGEHGNKFCHDQVIQLSKSSASAYTTSVATIGKCVAWVNTQTFGYYGTVLDLNRSTALMAGYIASLDVNRPLTAKIIPGITSVSPAYNTSAGELGATLLSLNVPFLECRNTMTQDYYCVNSMLPNGLDMYINRTRDYILNRIRVEPFLGDPNSEKTIEGIDNVVGGIVEECVDTLGLLKDVIYRIERVSATQADVIIEKMVFDGVITRIDIHYSIEVQ